MGTLNSRLQEVQVPTAGTVPSLLSTRSLRFFIRLKSAAAQRFIFKEGQRVALAGRYDQKPLKLVRAKVFSSTGLQDI